MTDLYPIPQSLTLSQHDLILSYSDGFTEIKVENSLWGEAGLLSAIPNGAKRIKPLTHHIVEAAQRAGSIRDDQSLVMAIYTRE
jgi:hypothetical protein